MRLPFIAPADLSTEQRQIYEAMRTGIGKSFQGFESIAENGALIGRAQIEPDLFQSAQ
jgi:4-carboxymuconolactone decarboxylase